MCQPNLGSGFHRRQSPIPQCLMFPLPPSAGVASCVTSGLRIVYSYSRFLQETVVLVKSSFSVPLTRGNGLTLKHGGLKVDVLETLT